MATQARIFGCACWLREKVTRCMHDPRVIKGDKTVTRNTKVHVGRPFYLTKSLHTAQLRDDLQFDSPCLLQLIGNLRSREPTAGVDNNSLVSSTDCP
jgi:hypothetical protein